MKPPHAVIMVTLDCVRPDHLGFNGYRGVDTPNLDRTAAEGVVFEEAICQAPNTWVSHAAIFTGCNPYKNGVRTHSTVLSEHVTTIAEAFSKAGYATAAFPAHTLVGPARGFHRGFDFFDLDESEFLHASASSEHKFYRDWSAMWSKAKAWISAQKGPFLVWLHYMGTHWEPHESLSLPDEYRHRYSAHGQYFDGKISWADVECIGAIADYLEESGIYQDSIFAIFSDHGDDLPANDPPYVWGGHNQNLFDVVMKIALIMRAPGRLPPSTRIKNQVRSIDIMPTLLELSNIPIPESVEGASLVSCCNNTPESKADMPQLAFLENMPRHWLAIRTLEWKLILTDTPERPPESEPPGPADTAAVIKSAAQSALEVLRTHKEKLHPLIHSSFQLVYRPIRWCFRHMKGLGKSEPAAQPPPEAQPRPLPFESNVLENGRVFGLYDLRQDPEEKTNVAENHPEIVVWLKKELSDMIARSSRAELKDMSERDREEVERRLEALGYL